MAANARKIKQAVLNLSDSKKSIILSVINFRAFVWQGQPLTPAYWVIPKLILLSKICSALLILVLVAVAGWIRTSLCPAIPSLRLAPHVHVLVGRAGFEPT
jgi:hypothetical protein